MSKSQKKSFNAPDETRTPQKTKFEIVKFGDMSVVRMTCQPGWRWSEHIRPIAGTDTCQGTHFSYVISGHLRTVMDDGTQFDIGPGDIAITAPVMMPGSSAMNRSSCWISRMPAGMSPPMITHTPARPLRVDAVSI